MICCYSALVSSLHTTACKYKSDSRTDNTSGRIPLSSDSNTVAKILFLDLLNVYSVFLHGIVV